MQYLYGFLVDIGIDLGGEKRCYGNERNGQKSKWKMIIPNFIYNDSKEKKIMAEYKEDREQYYLAMMKEISGHKDFGRKNPVDIGTECGYTEEDVLDMIHMLQQKKVNGEIYTGTSSDKIGYFLVWKEQKAYIVAVEMQDWKAEVVKELKGFERKDKFDIKDHIFIRTAGNEKKTVLWENLETGEKKRLLTDEAIRNLIILDYGILILMETEMLVWDGDKILTEKKYTDSMLGVSEVIQAGDSIYFYSAKNSYIYAVDKLLKREISKYYVMTEATTGSSEKRRIEEIGSDGNKIFGYWSVAKNFYYPSTIYRDYPLKTIAMGGKEFAFKRKIKDHLTFIAKDFMSQNYGLLGTEIYSRKQMESPNGIMNPVCGFNRTISDRILCNQVIVDFENDVFIGLNHENDIIKIDMRNEREAMVIPVTI